GLPEVELYKEVARMLKQSDIHQFVGVGENMVKYRSEFDILENVAVHFFKSTDDLLGYVRNYQAQNEAILLKGARTFQFEKIIRILEAKIHQTTLIIDMAAMLHNFNVYKSHLKPGVKMMVMVKASSYGS